MTDWDSEQLAVFVLIASVASTVIAVVILADGGRRYAYAALAGLLGGTVLRCTPVGGSIATKATGVFYWIGQPITGVLFAFTLALVVDVLLSWNLPLLKRIRPNGRLALRPSTWGSAQEIAARAGTSVSVVRFLGLGIPVRSMDTRRIMSRARITANVVCGSCILLFFAVPCFVHELLHNLTPSKIPITLVGAALVTFFLGPLHEAVLRLFDMAPAHDEPAPHSEKSEARHLAVIFFQLLLTGALLALLQAMHSAIHEQITSITPYGWILLLELCALPLLVTTYYFGAALHRPELGEDRWLRAFQASAWVGTIVLVPFALVILLPDNFSPAFRAQLTDALLGPGPGTIETIGLGVITAVGVVLLAAALAGICSLATYGVYAMALAIAMSYATTPARARAFGFVAICTAGLVAQGITSAAGWWWPLPIPAFHYIHLLLALGWALGLLVSRFELSLRSAERP